MAVFIVGFFDLLRAGFAEPGATARVNGELGAQTPWYRNTNDEFIEDQNRNSALAPTLP